MSHDVLEVCPLLGTHFFFSLKALGSRSLLSCQTISLGRELLALCSSIVTTLNNIFPCGLCMRCFLALDFHDYLLGNPALQYLLCLAYYKSFPCGHIASVTQKLPSMSFSIPECVSGRPTHSICGFWIHPLKFYDHQHHLPYVYVHSQSLTTLCLWMAS